MAAKLWVGLGGVYGLGGLVLKAMAFHQAGPRGISLDTAGDILLLHALALLLTVSFAARLGRLAHIIAAAFAVGAALFAGPIALSRFTGIHEVGFLSPIGGALLMVGWALVMVAALRLRP